LRDASRVAAGRPTADVNKNATTTVLMGGPISV
jgi:hypothetical protein